MSLSGAHKSSRVTWYIILSILFHLSLIIIYLEIDTLSNLFNTLLSTSPAPHEQSPPELSEPEPNSEQAKELAALKMAKSVFGAPIVFEEDAEFSPEEYDPSAQPQESDHETDEQLTESAEPISSARSEDIPPQETTMPTEPAHAEIGPSDQPPQIPVPLPTPPEPIAQSIATSTNARGTEKNPPQPRRPHRTDRMPGQGRKNSAPIKKEQVTFADLANGFLDTLHDQNGRDFASRSGSESIRADMQEMKYLSYMQKVCWQIQNAWKRNNHQLTESVPDTAYISFVFHIDAEGNLTKLDIVEKTGYAQLDKLLIRSVKEATPFPPLPKHFKTDLYHMPSRWTFVNRPDSPFSRKF